MEGVLKLEMIFSTGRLQAGHLSSGLADTGRRSEARAAARFAVALVVAQFVFVNRHRCLAKLPPNQALGQARPRS